VSKPYAGVGCVSSEVEDLADKLVGYTITRDSGKTPTDYVTSCTGYTFGLDPAKSPKTITTSKLLGFEGVTFQGLYELDRDTLKVALCVSQLGARPKEFKSSRDSGILILTLKRAQ
jgi:uncharacterized protein (TIGR03067 family)